MTPSPTGGCGPVPGGPVPRAAPDGSTYGHGIGTGRSPRETALRAPFPTTPARPGR